jgi:hypothetical protein
MVKKLKKLQLDKELETYFENFNKKYWHHFYYNVKYI